MPNPLEKMNPVATRNVVGIKMGDQMTSSGVAINREMAVAVSVKPESTRRVPPTVAAVRNMAVWLVLGALSVCLMVLGWSAIVGVVVTVKW